MKEQLCSVLTVTGTVTPQSMHISHRVPWLDQPVPNMQHPETISRSSQRTEHCKMHLDTSAWMHRPPEKRAVCLCYVFTCMWCMHAGYVLHVFVIVCKAFSLHYKVHLVCECARVCVCVLHSMANSSDDWTPEHVCICLLFVNVYDLLR